MEASRIIYKTAYETIPRYVLGLAAVFVVGCADTPRESTPSLIRKEAHVDTEIEEDFLVTSLSNNPITLRLVNQRSMRNIIDDLSSPKENLKAYHRNLETLIVAMR